LNAPDVVKAGIPLPALAAEGVGETARDCVAFENEDSLPGF